MPAPKGNQFWKNRTKHGRDRIVKSPEALREAADEYFQWCIDNPILQKDYRGKDAIDVYLEHPRVFTKEGVARFCHLAAWREVADLANVNKDFAQVVTHIESTIREQKFTYASIGMFNANIIARDLGLADKNQTQALDKDGKPADPVTHVITIKR